MTALSLPDNGKYHQDNLNITLQFPDGSIGTITYLANGSRSYKKEYIEVFCGGKIGILDDFQSLELVDAQKRGVFKSRLRQDKGHQSAWHAFSDAIISGTDEPITYDAILNVSYATLACRKSLETGEPVFLKDHSFRLNMNLTKKAGYGFKAALQLGPNQIINYLRYQTGLRAATTISEHPPQV